MSSIRKFLFFSLIIVLYTIPFLVTIFLYEHPQTHKTENLIENIGIFLVPILAFFSSIILLYRSKLSSKLIFRISVATTMVPFCSNLIADDFLFFSKSIFETILLALFPLVTFLVPGNHYLWEFLDAYDIKRGIKSPVIYGKYKFRKK